MKTDKFTRSLLQNLLHGLELLYIIDEFDATIVLIPEKHGVQIRLEKNGQSAEKNISFDEITYMEESDVGKDIFIRVLQGMYEKIRSENDCMLIHKPEYGPEYNYNDSLDAMRCAVKHLFSQQIGGVFTHIDYSTKDGEKI